MENSKEPTTVSISQEHDYKQLKNHVSQLIERQMKKYKVTGLSLALVDGQETVWCRGFGYADKGKGAEAAAETRYLIGSTTKLFTGTAIMQLSDIGLIDIDMPVQEYIPEFSIKTRFINPEPITIRSLMTHHSGIPCDNFHEFYNDNPGNQSNSFRNVVDYLKEHYTAYPPNYIWSYSNLGTALLGVIIERVTGVDFCEYIEKNILMPLSMKESSTVTKKEIKDSMAKAYKNNKLEDERYLRDLPAGSIVSTARDMSNFIKMVLGEGIYGSNQILKKDTLLQMLTPQNGNIPLDAGFKTGLNWFLEWPYFDYAGKVCWHDGSSVHYNSLLVVLPDQKLGIALLSNSTTALPAFLREIAEEALIQALKLKKCKPELEEKTSTLYPIPFKEMVHYEGTFATIMGLASIKKIKNRLKLNLMNLSFDLVPNQDGWHSLRLNLLGFIPVNIKKLQNMRIKIQIIDNEKIFQLEQKASRHEFRQSMGREFVKKKVPDAWRDRVGRYDAVERNNSVARSLKVSYYKGILSIKATARKVGKMHLILDAVSDSEAVIMGLGRFAGETVTAGNDNGVPSIEVYGLRFIKSK